MDIADSYSFEAKLSLKKYWQGHMLLSLLSTHFPCFREPKP